MLSVAVPTLASGSGADEADESEALPLSGETQRLDLTLREGSWISLDVMPDGDFIVFELLGDLFKVPIDGGTATALTTGLGYDSQPRVSPDGNWLTFVSDRSGAENLWVARIDGSDARQLSEGDHNSLLAPEFSPDSQYVIVPIGGQRSEKLTIYHRDGGSGVALTPVPAGDGNNAGNGDGIRGVSPVYSPDGRYIYFAQAVEGSGSPARAIPAAQIARFDLETGQVDPVTRGIGGGLAPRLSPDGQMLAYATRHETVTTLRLRNLVTGADRELFRPIQQDSQERTPTRGYVPGYDFTPDGQAIIISLEGGLSRIDIATGSVAKIPFTAQLALETGPDLTAPYRVPQGPVTATIAQTPVFSPDGKNLAVSALARLYVMDADADADGDTGPERLTQGDTWEFQPAYSPDGRWIAYVTWSMNEGGHIWRMRANGRGTPERLTEHPAFYTELAWSPDGERIVALRGSEFQRHRLFSEFFGFPIPLDLIWIAADGGPANLIRPARGDRRPHFGPESDRIYTYSENGLHSVAFDGTDRRTHLKVTGPKTDPSGTSEPAAEQILIHPHGGYAMALVNKQVYVIPVIETGSDAPTVAVRGPALPIARLTDIGADHIGWAEDGRRVVWAIGSTVYSRPLDSIDFGEETSAENDRERSEANGPGAAEPEAAQDEITEPRDFHESVRSLKVTVTRPRPAPDGDILLAGGNVIAMAGADDSSLGRILTNADVLVRGNRIAAVGPAGSLVAADDVTRIDVSGQYIIPGLVDTHAHWEFRTQDVLEPQNWSLVANLAYGVTSGLDVQTAFEDYFAYRDMVETGQTIGQRAFMTGPGIFAANDFQSYAETLAYLRRYSDHYMTNNIKSYLVGNRKQRQWVVKASKALGLMPTTEGGGSFELDITHAIDGMHGNEHTLPDSPLYDDVIQLFARTRTAYTPTLLVQYNAIPAREYFFATLDVHDNAKLARFYPHNRLDELTRRRPVWARESEYRFAEAAAQAAKIQRAGGLVGIGGHGEVQGLGYHWEMWALAAGGMTPGEIMRAATIDGARIIGIDTDLGSVEAGKLADLVILDASPLDDIRNSTAIDMVMKNGVLYDGDTLDQIWPEERPLPRFWWWEDE